VRRLDAALDEGKSVRRKNKAASSRRTPKLSASLHAGLFITKCLTEFLKSPLKARDAGFSGNDVVAPGF
jgi:hypothetical protein